MAGFWVSCGLRRRAEPARDLADAGGGFCRRCCCRAGCRKERPVITWYAVYTRPHGETAALENLLRQGYCAYLPRYKTRVRHARRLQSVLRPLFPRYLFAGIDRSSMPWRPILSTIGVTDVVRAGDEPYPVATDIVTTLQEQEMAGALAPPRGGGARGAGAVVGGTD